MSTCARCGVEIRWVTVEGKGKVPLDAGATFEGTYALDPSDVDRAYPIERPGLYGHEDHNKTCREPIR